MDRPRAHENQRDEWLGGEKPSLPYPYKNPGFEQEDRDGL